jgi:hypothetical protein
VFVLHTYNQEKVAKLAERKRKKNEELLERARLRRLMGNDNKAENNGANSSQDAMGNKMMNNKSNAALKKGKNKKSEEEVVIQLTPEQTMEEAERVALIAAKRKQFKMNHKKHLSQLSEKRKQEEMAKVYKK